MYGREFIRQATTTSSCSMTGLHHCCHWYHAVMPDTESWEWDCEPGGSSSCPTHLHGMNVTLRDEVNGRRRCNRRRPVPPSRLGLPTTVPFCINRLLAVCEQSRSGSGNVNAELLHSDQILCRHAQLQHTLNIDAWHMHAAPACIKLCMQSCSNSSPCLTAPGSLKSTPGTAANPEPLP